MDIHGTAFEWLWVEAVHVLGKGGVDRIHEPPGCQLQSVQSGRKGRALEEDPGYHGGQHAQIVDARHLRHLRVRRHQAAHHDLVLS